MNNPLSLNLYTYVQNNPLRYVDPSGHIPSPLEAAYMAEAIYHVTKKDVGGPALEGGWILKELYEGTEGLKIGVYTRITWGVREYVLVNKGTSTDGDWINNFQQPFGYSTDMTESIDYAKKFVNKNAGIEVTMVGHSKGGGEATANAIATNTNAITFNPAPAYLPAYGLREYDIELYDKTMTHYIVKGDILTGVLGTPMVGKTKYLPSQYKIKLFDSYGVAVEKGKQNHSMDSVINALLGGGHG